MLGTHDRSVCLFVVLAVLLPAQVARSDDIRVMTSGAFTAAYRQLGPQFERATGHRLVTEATTMGTGATSIEARLAAGESVDVVIVDDGALQQWAERGRVVPGTRVPLARSQIGMVVRRGAPKPDIGSVDALRQTLLSARSIAYSASVSGTYLSTELFQRLGVADTVLPRSRRIEGERVAAVVARGEAEIGFQQISELLPEPGVDFVGPLPGEAQKTTVFSAGVAAASRHPVAARQFIDFLASPSSAAAIAKTGLEPIARESVANVARSSPPGDSSARRFDEALQESYEGADEPGAEFVKPQLGQPASRRGSFCRKARTSPICAAVEMKANSVGLTRMV